MLNRFADVATTTYTLADGGDTVEFRNALTWGERTRLAADTSIIEDGTARVDWAIYQSRRLAVYLMGWSFKGMDGAAIFATLESIEAMDGDTGDELAALLDTHLAAMASLKNAPASTPA